MAEVIFKVRVRATLSVWFRVRARFRVRLGLRLVLGLGLDSRWGLCYG